MPWYTKLFLALGGASLVIATAVKGAEPAGKAAVGFLLRFAWFQRVVYAHKAEIKQALENFEKGEEEAIDGAQPPPTAS